MGRVKNIIASPTDLLKALQICKDALKKEGFFTVADVRSRALRTKHEVLRILISNKIIKFQFANTDFKTYQWVGISPTLEMARKLYKEAGYKKFEKGLKTKTFVEPVISPESSEFAFKSDTLNLKRMISLPAGTVVIMDGYTITVTNNSQLFY